MGPSLLLRLCTTILLHTAFSVSHRRSIVDYIKKWDECYDRHNMFEAGPEKHSVQQLYAHCSDSMAIAFTQQQ